MNLNETLLFTPSRLFSVWSHLIWPPARFNFLCILMGPLRRLSVWWSARKRNVAPSHSLDFFSVSSLFNLQRLGTRERGENKSYVPLGHPTRKVCLSRTETFAARNILSFCWECSRLVHPISSALIVMKKGDDSCSPPRVWCSPPFSSAHNKLLPGELHHRIWIRRGVKDSLSLDQWNPPPTCHPFSVVSLLSINCSPPSEKGNRPHADR